MPRYLILRLDSPMQAWGTHTFEDFRPSNLFPTRSGLLGLLGACLGIERDNQIGLEQLAVSVEFTVRVDRRVLRLEAKEFISKIAIKLPDFHTILDARKVDGTANKNPVVSRREYLFDAAFTVAIGEKAECTGHFGSPRRSFTSTVFYACIGKAFLPHHSAFVGR